MNVIDILHNEILARLSSLPSEITIKTPYYSQWESPELVDSILNKTVDPRVDPNWKKSGAESPEEYAFVSWSICGMACLKMIIASRKNQVIPLAELFHKAAQAGAYKTNNKKPTFPYEFNSNDIDGVFYKPLVKHLKERYGLKANSLSYMSMRRILFEISKNHYVIASVHPSIRNPNAKKPLAKGGHMVLIVGYDQRNKQLIIHNPSGYYQKTQIYAKITFTDFSKFFAQRGVLVY